MANKQISLQLRNMQDQLNADEEYKAMFGGEDLVIKRARNRRLE